MNYYTDLLVWQKSMDLVVLVYQLVNLLPKEELYALSNQMRRSAVSIPSNIAEGQQRNTSKDFKSFLIIARGSNAELEPQLLLCTRLHYLSEDQIEPAMNLCSEIAKMLSSFIMKL